MSSRWALFCVCAALVVVAMQIPQTAIVTGVRAEDAPAAAGKYDPTALLLDEIDKMHVGKHDWPQWFGWSSKNNTPEAKNLPEKWDVSSGENVLWSAQLGSQSYGNPVVANGKVFVGTNNGAGYLARFPADVDLGCLLCFDEKTGKFLWQASSPKLPTGRVHDWPLQGICCSPYIEGDRAWYVTSRGEVACVDIEGFHDGENDGPYKSETNQNKDEADYVWLYDMMGELGTSQHNMCSCSISCMGNYLFVNTSNGVDESHNNIPAPTAPSFMVMDKTTGYVLWTDKSPGENIHHGQWSSPSYSNVGGKVQVLFGGGDGWLYSFAPEGDGKGHAKLYWKLDCNPKDSLLELGGRGTRNDIIATPVIYDGMIYVATGQDPEHGEGVGVLWCIDPTKEGDVSETLVVDAKGEKVPHRRIIAVDTAKGEKVIPNPNSAIKWKYMSNDANGNGKMEFEEIMHRTIGSCAIKDDILYIADFSGLVHCLDAKTGKPYWAHDMFAQSWGSPLIADGKVYIGDEDGEITVFKHSKELEILSEVDMESSVYSSPIAANDTLFIANKSTIFAIGKKKE
jgi:outer membrane protein assembly factor BamB